MINHIKIKKMGKIYLFRKLLITVALIFAITEIQAQVNQGAVTTGRPKPDYQHVAYDSGPLNILNIYIAEGTRNGPPTPLYVWGHGAGGSLDGFPHQAWAELNGAGISAISWESLDNIRTPDEFNQCMRDLEKVMAFVFENATKYNFDTSKIVIGGSSRGSFISWEYSHSNPQIVKGIYSAGALGDPLMWSEVWEPRGFIHVNSPPLFFTYRTVPGDGNVHNPKSGMLIKQRYEELGIGDRARVEHSLEERGLNQWSFIADFIREVTSK
jgi:pimeloyl-ACP methyl ester carboxylesterase